MLAIFDDCSCFCCNGWRENTPTISGGLSRHFWVGTRKKPVAWNLKQSVLDGCLGKLPFFHGNDLETIIPLKQPIKNGCLGNQVCNEKRAPGCLGYVGDYTTQLSVDYFINHEIRIPIKQPVFHGKY